MGAMDISWPKLEGAREAAEAERTGPEDGLFLARADVEALPLREGTVDFAWWGLGLHLVANTGAALRSVFAALRPGSGRLVATASERSVVDPTAELIFSVEEIARLAEEAGFVGIEVTKPQE